MSATLGRRQDSNIEFHGEKVLYKEFPPLHHFDGVTYERLTSNFGVEVVSRGNSDNLVNSSGFRHSGFSSTKFDGQRRFFIGERGGAVALYLDVNTERFSNGIFRLNKELYMDIWRTLNSFVVINLVQQTTSHPALIPQEGYVSSIGDLMTQLLLSNAKVSDDKN